MRYKALVTMGMFVTAWLLAGCDNELTSRSGVDLVAQRESLIEADLEFAAAAARDGLAQAYLEYLAEDAVQLPDGGLPVVGREAIYANVEFATESGDFLLTWEPEAAEVSASGDLGYTWGAYLLEVAGDSGEPEFYEGKYVNIWSKSTNGRWKIILDISNENYSEFVDLPDQTYYEPDLVEPGAAE